MCPQNTSLKQPVSPPNERKCENQQWGKKDGIYHRERFVVIDHDHLTLKLVGSRLLRDRGGWAGRSRKR
jgi:hypothetical protein